MRPCAISLPPHDPAGVHPIESNPGTAMRLDLYSENIIIIKMEM
jgi:hypothetical protein